MANLPPFSQFHSRAAATGKIERFTLSAAPRSADLSCWGWQFPPPALRCHERVPRAPQAIAVDPAWTTAAHDEWQLLSVR